ncbi:hypothetical protein IAU60_000126 [Kwoniella sp. DSM 27419]
MNGEPGARDGATSLSDGVALSLDPVTLDSALGKRRVQAIDLDGSIVYEDEKKTDDQLTEQLERIWNEYPGGLLDISEETLAALPAEGTATEDATQNDTAPSQRDTSKMMEHEAMEGLRTEVFGQLNDARNELWFVLELAKTLAASSSFTSEPPLPPGQLSNTAQANRKGKAKSVGRQESDSKVAVSVSAPTEPPILPPGTYTTVPSYQTSKPSHAQVKDIELVLAAKQQALAECSALIDSAVGELQSMAAGGDRFWKDVKMLKQGYNGRGQWAVVPKPDFGRSMGEGEKAKDIIIPYAIEESSRAQRARCLAAFDLDPKQEEALAFGARTHLRLRITLKDDSGSIVGSTHVVNQAHADVRMQMNDVQMEAFEEELFTEIRYEAGRMAHTEMSPRSVSVPAAEYTLAFELYDSRDTSSVPSSPLCDLIGSAARLNMINLHRFRKAHAIGRSDPDMMPSEIIHPIIQALQYRRLYRTIDVTLETLANTLRIAGVPADVTRQTSAVGSPDEMIQAFLTGRSGVDKLCVSFSLQIADSPGIKIDLSAPGVSRVTLSRATFELSNPADLAHVLSEELADQLLHMAGKIVRDTVPAEARRLLFFDHLEGLIGLGVLGNLRVTIPPPFHSVVCHIEKVSDGGSVDKFDSRQAGDLRGWLRRVSERMASTT